MAKIIKVSEELVYIGKDDGSILECQHSDLDFEPIVGKKVEIFSNNSTEIITEVLPENNFANVQSTTQDGINIHIDNSNSNSNSSSNINNNQTGSQTVYKPGKVVNKVAYLLIIFFLGAFGIHKFYAGKIGTGILFILFSWTGIPLFIAVIDFISALFKRPDDLGNIVV